jgi:hypothetical protein
LLLLLLSGYIGANFEHLDQSFVASLLFLLSHLSVSVVLVNCSAFAGHFEFDPQTGPARLLTFSIAFWALLMGAAYTGESSSSVVSPGILFLFIGHALTISLLLLFFGPCIFFTSLYYWQPIWHPFWWSRINRSS